MIIFGMGSDDNGTVRQLITLSLTPPPRNKEGQETRFTCSQNAGVADYGNTLYIGLEWLDLDPIKMNDGNENKETMMMMMLLRTKMAMMAMILRRW